MDAVKRYGLFLLPVLVSCGGGGSVSTDSGLQNDAFNPTGRVVNACSSDYYRELVGDYDGQIRFANDDGLVCTWEVELQVSSAYTTDPALRQICDLNFNMVSSGATVGCADVGIGGSLLDTLAASRDQWVDVPWPVDAFAEVSSAIPDSSVYPIGIAGIATRQFTITFDGRGNVTFPDSVSVEPEYSGVLVKQ